MMNRQWIYNEVPENEITDNTFRLISSPMPECKGDGDVLVKTLFISVDPYLRIQMSRRDTWEEPKQTGGVQTSGAVCQVVESRHPQFVAGDTVLTYSGWTEYAVVNGDSISKVVIDPAVAPASAALGVLGMPARTAYFGTLEVVRPNAGDTFVVSGAAGAVGSLVGQIAKIKGCYVVGIAGSDEKLRWLKDELGFDAVINYKTCGPSIKDALAAACSRGIDCYFDNVGGVITDAVFELLNVRGRVGICGQISQYNGGLDQPEMGPRFLHRLIYIRARIEGMLARDFADRHQEMVAQMSEWIRQGRVKYSESVVDGFENVPKALQEMMHGANIGKQVVKV